MSTAAKVLIIVNLILGLLFAVGELTLFGKRVNWVKQTRLAISETNDVYAELKTKINQMTGEYEKAKGEVEILQTQINSRDNELAAAKAKFESVTRERDVYEKELAEKRNETSNYIAQLKTSNDRNTKLQGKLNDEITQKRGLEVERDWHSNRAIEAAADLVESESEMMQLAKNNAELVRRVTLLSTQLDNYVRRYGADAEASANPAGVAISGRVLRVESALNLVILSVGEKDKVQKGMEFVISRDQNYVAKVRVANVYDEMCSAQIIDGMTANGQKVTVSDTASTLN
ncbi:hypothetical protein FACS1894139_10080 [Planctomycetales bacterium]|nr:hypothetical protein FACS1894107_01620 [Planctomycetales bacterium]GHS97254.1 hypothetical protein FACS1894108_03330 [Planctomycetales bacterium]GHT05726.1 hypothetical protein FACS1894139_10080 [Planctomycetales bacterium]